MEKSFEQRERRMEDEAARTTPHPRTGPIAGEPMLSGDDDATAPSLPERTADAIADEPPMATRPTFDPTPVAPERADEVRVGSRRHPVRRRILIGVGVVMVAGIGYFLVTLAQVWSTGRTHDSAPVDAIVVMGAAQYDGRPSPQLAARLDHVVELWPDGIAPLVVVTGGNIPGDRFTEAEASASYLEERGVPESSILMENDGSTSYESLQAVSILLEDRGLDDVLIVTDPYHSLRSRLIAEEVGLHASVSSTQTSVVTGGDALRRELEEAGGVAVGRIIGFGRLSRLVG